MGKKGRWRRSATNDLAEPAPQPPFCLFGYFLSLVSHPLAWLSYDHHLLLMSSAPLFRVVFLLSFGKWLMMRPHFSKLLLLLLLLDVMWMGNWNGTDRSRRSWEFIQTGSIFWGFLIYQSRELYISEKNSM